MTIPTTIIVTQSGGRFLVFIGEILGDGVLCNGVAPAKSPYIYYSLYLEGRMFLTIQNVQVMSTLIIFTLILLTLANLSHIINPLFEK